MVRLGELDDALHLAHDLKGVSATSGAMQLSVLAAAVLQGLRPQADTAALPANAQAVVAEMQRLADGLLRLQAAAPALGARVRLAPRLPLVSACGRRVRHAQRRGRYPAP